MSDDAELPTGSDPALLRVRGSYRLMVDRVFGLFFWGKVLSSQGTWIHNIVAAIVAFQITGSALAVGLVSAVQFTPQLLFAPWSGTMADRGRLTPQIALGRTMVGTGSGGLALMIWLVGGVDELPGLVPVLLSSLVVGLGLVVGGPAMQSIVPSLIRPGEMAAAMALNSVPMTLARAGGPAIGAVVALHLGPAVAFGVAAAVNYVYAVIMLMLRVPYPRPRHGNTDFSVRAGLRHVRADRPLLVLLLGVTAVAFGAEPSVTLAPVLAHDLGGGADLVGWLASSFGAGAALGFFMFGPLHARLSLARLTHGGLLLMAAGLTCASLSTVQALALASYGMTGVGMTLALTSATTQIQNRSPDALRGRIMALWFVGFLGARPFAAGLDGFIADVVSVQAALLMTAGILLLAAAVCRPKRLNVDPPPSEEQRLQRLEHREHDE